MKGWYKHPKLNTRGDR